MDKETIKHVAKLAKLNLTDKEVERFVDQLSPILDYVNKLNELDTKDVEPTSHPISELKNRFQEEGMDEALDIEDVTRNAKEKNGNYVVTEGVL